MGLEQLAADAGNIGSIGQGIGDMTSALFGSETNVSGTVKKTAESEQRSRLELDEEGINKIISDILGSEQGLAQIFSKENVAGIYDSSVSAQASGDLVANLVGELAKLTAETVSTREDTTKTKTEETTKDKGLFGFLGI